MADCQPRGDVSDTTRDTTRPEPLASAGGISSHPALNPPPTRRRGPARDLPSRLRGPTRVAANLVGAAGAALFVRSGLENFRSTHSLVEAAFLVAQLWVVSAYLIRRPAVNLSLRTRDWLLAFGGTFGGVLYRPAAYHVPRGIELGLVLQVAGLALCMASFLSLGRSFGFAPADRGIKQRGAYSLVRHPIYASYLLLQLGYVSQSTSVRNGLVMALVCGCDVGRIFAEERLLSANPTYARYRTMVRWRIIPGLW